MNSQKGSGSLFKSGVANSSSKGKKVSEYNPGVEDLAKNVSDISLNSSKDAGWEVYVKKPKNKAWNRASKQCQNSGQGAGSWSAMPADARRPGTGCSSLPRGPNQVADSGKILSAPVVSAPLKHGWNWAARTASVEPTDNVPRKGNEVTGFENEEEKEDYDDDDGSDMADEFDDDFLSDDLDSDSSEKSHETLKKNRWFKDLFDCMDALSVEQINDPERRWHCPACKGGPGAIDWYRGLLPLITHAKTKGSQKVKLHRELARLLEEELQRRGTSAVPAGEAFGKWKGLDGVTEKEIVWPPMVIIMNTRLDKVENDKWIGMGNQELLDYFSSYEAEKARHSYGPQGHRGMSVLIFEPSAVGYLKAERLSKHFADNKRDRDAWDRNRVPFIPGGNRQLYGYMAENRDLDIFNQHCQGKFKLKYEMQSYIEMVVNQLKKMSEDNQQLVWFKNRVAKEQRHSKALEESYGFLSEKLRKTEEENRIVRLRTKMHHEQNKEEMDFQEQFFREQIQSMYDARNAKEDNFEKIQQGQREKMSLNLSSVEDPRQRAAEVEKFIKLQDKEMGAFVEERDKLIKEHEEELAALTLRHWEEKVALEKKFDAELGELMQSYIPQNSGLDESSRK